MIKVVLYAKLTLFAFRGEKKCFFFTFSFESE